MNDKAYWIWLQKALGTGVKTDEIVAYYKTAKEIYFASPEDRGRSGVFTKLQLQKLKETPLEVIDQVIEDCRKCGCRVLTPDSEKYPEKLRQIRNFPLVLYYYGNPDILKDRMTIAIVGTRNATKAGLTTAHRLSYSLVKSGAVVVSGGAFGIDGASHLGALNGDGETVAVLGCGFMAKYHDSAENLKKDILRKGLIITEHPPATPAHASYFPVRNRIISGLSYGVVVVECPIKSGSVITAKCALEQGREVFAVSVNVLDSQNTGTIDLLRRFNAIPVYSCSDVLSVFEFTRPGLLDYSKIDSSPLYESAGEIDFSAVTKTSHKKQIETKDNKEIKETKETKNEVLKLTGNAETVYKVLSDKPMHIDDITRNIPSLSVGRIMVSLTQLEMEGLVVSDSGKKYRRK